jgi:hypothetical protein
MMAPPPPPSLPMSGISDRSFSIACGRLASHLGISLAAARRKVEIRAAQQNNRDPAALLATAEALLADAIAEGGDNGALLTNQLEAVDRDNNFMVED